MRKKFISKQKLICFRQYSRKKFAAFNSLGKVIKISTLCAACSLIVSPVQGQTKGENDSVSKKLDLEEVEVVGQKSTILLNELPRMVELITVKAIQNNPSQSFQDLLGYHSNIDIRQRGPFGTQADVSIRGGSFDQTLVLLNGTNLSDPQTGHHSLNLPIDQETISKIEVLNGPSARSIGANAYSGAINVITRPIDKNQVTASLNFGQYNFMREHLSVNLVSKNTKNLFTGGYAQSDGYAKNTDFKNYHFFYHGIFNLNSTTNTFVQLGYSEKGFGANSFYSAKYPVEYEWNKNMFFNAGINTGREIKTKSQVYWRRHYDRFELYREGNGYYVKDTNGLYINSTNDTAGLWYTNHNYHVTDILGTDLNITVNSIAGKTSFGGSLRSENIMSNLLGNNLVIPVEVKGADSVYYTKQASRNNMEIYAEHVYRNEYLLVSAGSMVNWNSFTPDKFYLVPGIDINLMPVKYFSVIGSLNSTLGMPTFTDLNYQDPSNQGNNQLKPYTQLSIEGGIKYQSDVFKVKTVLFATNGKNNIEWVYNDTTFKFSPINVPVSKSKGFEISFDYQSREADFMQIIVKRIFLGYTFINTYRETPEAVSKYSNMRQKFVANLQQEPLPNLILSWNFMFKERTGYYLTYDFENNKNVANKYPEALVVDLRISYSFKSIGMYIEGANLTDNIYYEAGSIPQPGRWIRGGINIKISKKD